MMKKKSKLSKKLAIFVLIVILIITTFRIGDEVLKNIALKDSGALFGGKLENSYEYAGYFILDKNNGSYKICGTAFVSPTQAITAAHCIDNGEAYVGVGKFSNNQNDYISVIDINVHPQWEKSDIVGNDMALLTLAKPVYLNEYAELGEASPGCNYLIVGYGQQDEETNFKPLRKSAELCVEELSDLNESISFNGKDGGLCFGDSGSPIFEKGTNKFVTIASRIDSCYIANFGVGPKLDTQIDLATFNFDEAPTGFKCGAIDTNGDGRLTIIDYSDFADSFLEKCTDSYSDKICGGKDVNKDGKVDLIDYASFAKRYQKANCKL